MKLVAIRDDDTSFFTDPAKLAEVHAPLIEKAVPLNLSIIPLVQADTEVRHEKMTGYEPFIPEGYRGRDECFDIGNNRGIVDFISRHPFLHVVQHGYRHAYVKGEREFEISATQELEKMADSGMRIIEKAFGTRPAFFVAPWDRISRAAYAVLAPRFDGISTGWLSKNSIPVTWLPKFLVKKLRGRNYIFASNTLVLEHPGCFLSMFSPPEQIPGRVMKYVNENDVTVLVTHHWEYYNENGSTKGPFLDAYHDVIAALTARQDVRIVSFPELLRSLKPA